MTDYASNFTEVCRDGGNVVFEWREFQIYWDTFLAYGELFDANGFTIAKGHDFEALAAKAAQIVEAYS